MFLSQQWFLLSILLGTVFYILWTKLHAFELFTQKWQNCDWVGSINCNFSYLLCRRIGLIGNVFKPQLLALADQRSLAVVNNRRFFLEPCPFFVTFTFLNPRSPHWITDNFSLLNTLFVSFESFLITVECLRKFVLLLLRLLFLFVKEWYSSSEYHTDVCSSIE